MLITLPPHSTMSYMAAHHSHPLHCHVQLTRTPQPVRKQAASAESLRQALERQIPRGLKEAEGVLEARERMLNALTSTAEGDVVRASSCGLCFASRNCHREFLHDVSRLAALITSIRDVTEEEEIGMEEHVARFVERCNLAASLWLVASIHVAEAACAHTDNKGCE